MASTIACGGFRENNHGDDEAVGSRLPPQALAIRGDLGDGGVMAKRGKNKKTTGCVYPVPENPGGICGRPLSGRGRWRWCPQHAQIIRKSQTQTAVSDWRSRY